MTMQLTITYGAVTLDMMANGYMLLDGFYPEAGSDPEKTTDKFNLLITGTSQADVVAKIRAINEALEWARRHPSGPDGVYLNFAPDASLDAGRSRILDGVVMLDARLDRNMRRDKATLSVAMERVNYWEGPETQVPLSNDNGTDDLAGLPVFNCNDLSGAAPAVRTNIIKIDGADVEGDLPGATRLELLNTYNDSNTLQFVWIGQGWEPDDIQYCIEGETSTTGSEVTDPASSGGKLRQATLPSGIETDLFTWSVTASYFNACKGHIFKAMGRFTNGVDTAAKFRLKFTSGGRDVWVSSPFMMDPTLAICLRDMLTLRLPPWLPGLTGLNALTMILTGEQEHTASEPINLDFLYFVPTDGWRSMQIPPTVAYQARLIDDGINEVVYCDDGAGASKDGYVLPYGEQIKLYPGKDQQLYFFQHSNLGDTGEIDRSLSAKLFYRPRWRSL